MKKRVYQGLGLGLIIASPVWVTMTEVPNYFTFAIAFVLGLLLVLLGRLS